MPQQFLLLPAFNGQYEQIQDHCPRKPCQQSAGGAEGCCVQNGTAAPASQYDGINLMNGGGESQMAGVPKVVIIGAGFGGLQCAKKLENKPVEVTLLDHNNYHLFTPLLYQVASSLLNPSDIAQPVRSILRGHRNLVFRQAEVTGVDFDAKRVLTHDAGDFAYDYLVIAAGSTTNFFGVAAAEQRSEGLKDLSEALGLRNHTLHCLEEAAATGSMEEARPWLTFVVVGGGPTGVEYSGALSELIHGVLPREYPELSASDVRVVLVEGLDRLLPVFPEDLGEEAQRALEARGVEVMTGLRVTDASEETVTLSNGDVISARTLVWAAGVKPAELAAALDVERSRNGRIEVDDALRVKGHTDVYAIGDVASFIQDGKQVPMLSAPAMQGGRQAADNILRTIAGERLKRFKYHDKGSMATVGKGAAVAQVGRFHFHGYIGWLMWLGVHIYYLIGFRNRLVVLSGWAWNYVRSDRPVRIIAKAK
jgi:NADH dehydrogenase